MKSPGISEMMPPMDSDMMCPGACLVATEVVTSHAVEVNLFWQVLRGFGAAVAGESMRGRCGRGGRGLRRR